jgi:hypothetical protein
MPLAHCPYALSQQGDLLAAQLPDRGCRTCADIQLDGSAQVLQLGHKLFFSLHLSLVHDTPTADRMPRTSRLAGELDCLSGTRGRVDREACFERG